MAVGGAAERARAGALPLRRWAVGGVAAATTGVVVLVLSPSRPLTVAGSVLVLAGSLAFVTAVISGVVRHQLRRQAEFVSRTVERGMLDTLPPGRAMEHLLARVYGESAANRDVATAVLGGEGAAHDGGDLTISEHTEIDFELSWISDTTYQLVMEQNYSFRNRVPTSSFVIFATSDTVLRDSIIAGCRLPLFELWFVGPSETYFEDSVEDMRESVRIGMHYRDADDVAHETPARHPGQHLREIKLRDWGRYLSFFRTDLPSGVAVDRQQYMDRLRIFEVDLHSLAESTASVATIQRLTIRSTTLQPLDAGFCYWQAPYPCYVERMGFDTKLMTAPAGDDFRFNLKPFTIRSPASPPFWTGGDAARDLPLGAWLLPGHGMALMWRPGPERHLG